MGLPFLHGSWQPRVQHCGCPDRQMLARMTFPVDCSPAGMSVKFAPMPWLPIRTDRLVSCLVSPLYCITHCPLHVPGGMLDHPGMEYVLGTTPGMRNDSLIPKKPVNVARRSAVCGKVLLVQLMVNPPAMTSTDRLVEASTIKPALRVPLPD